MIALVLAQRSLSKSLQDGQTRAEVSGSTKSAKSSALKDALKEVLTGKSIVLLLGGMAIGLIAGKESTAKIAPCFFAPFQGAVSIFLLEMGLVTARRLRDLKALGPKLLAYGCFVPLINGVIGVTFASFGGLSLGAATILGVLGASASYIAAPAAVRIALPSANPTIYLTASLAITFPFNLTVGIPIYYGWARWLAEVL